jgi:protein TonB
MKNPSKKSTVLFFFITLATSCFASINNKQVLRDTIPADSINIIFEKVEVEASFPGGMNAWRRFLEDNLDASVPVKNGAPAGYYTVVVQFIVDKEGKIQNLEALTHHGYGMETEVLRILRKAPNWIPAMQKGRYVKAFRKQPVTFGVIEEKEKKKKKKDTHP